MSKSPKTDWERFGRARKAEAESITELNAWRRNPRSFDVASYYGQVLIHRAHTIMLAEQGIITAEEAKTILEGVRAVEKAASEDPSLVGYMSTEENVDTLMPGYTHIRQAQPVTLAHYILAHVEAAARTVERLEGVYSRTNLSTMGAAAFAGTSWDVDRERVKELLGFDALLENTTDAVATTDYAIELASAIAIHMTQIGRLAEDLQIWSSDEYNMIDLDEAYAGTSSIMPQKKNPLEFEYIKGYSAESIGNLVTAVASVKGISYTNTVDRLLIEPVALDTAVGSTNVIAGAVTTITPKRDVMLKNLRAGFTTATDLADTLVRSHGLSFRQAHDIIVEVVVKAIEEGKMAEEIGPEMVADASEKVIEKKLRISTEELASALNKNLLGRNTVGGPAPEAVLKMIANRRSSVEEQVKKHEDRLMKVRRALEKLGAAEASIGF